jgi:hypothetical protein
VKCDRCGKHNRLGEPLTSCSVGYDGETYRLRLCDTCSGNARSSIMVWAMYSNDFDSPLLHSKPAERGPVHASTRPTVIATPTTGREELSYNERERRRRAQKIHFPVVRRDEVIRADDSDDTSVVAVEAIDGIPKELAQELVDTYVISRKLRARALEENLLPLKAMHAAHSGERVATHDDGIHVYELNGVRAKLDPATNVIVDAYHVHQPIIRR